MTSYTALTDTFARDNLPPVELQPEYIFELKGLQFPSRLNCAVELLDKKVSEGLGSKTAFLTAAEVWSYQGVYSGYTEDLPKEYFRGKVKTDEHGVYCVMGSMPIEYPMTSERHGPTGSLIEMLGGQGMRTKHVHHKYRKTGYETLTTQAYFRGEKYIEDDPVEAVFEDLTYDLKVEDGLKVLDLAIVLDPAKN